MAKQEPFRVPDLKDQVGWRLTKEDKQNLRILLADRRMTSVTALLRALVEQEAEPVRQRWQTAVNERAKEQGDG